MFPLTAPQAQSVTTAGDAEARERLPAIWVGTGVAAPGGSENSASPRRKSGGMLMAAIELPMRRTIGSASVALRAEGRWAQQSIGAVTGSGVSGNVQTLSTGLTLRAFPLTSRAATTRRVTPYVLAGVGITRSSTRVAVSISDPDMPTARFSQTSSEVAPAGNGGVGALIRIGRAQLFAEARTEFARPDAGTRRSSFGTVGISLQPHR